MLLCGIIVLVILRVWRAQTKTIPVRNQSSRLAPRANFRDEGIFFRVLLYLFGTTHQ